jgi:hypothetical protein
VTTDAAAMATAPHLTWTPLSPREPSSPFVSVGVAHAVAVAVIAVALTAIEVAFRTICVISASDVAARKVRWIVGQAAGVGGPVGDGVMQGGVGVAMADVAQGLGGVMGVADGSSVGVAIGVGVSVGARVGVDVTASEHGGELTVWLPSSQSGPPYGVTVTQSGETGLPVGMQSGSNVAAGVTSGGEIGGGFEPGGSMTNTPHVVGAIEDVLLTQNVCGPGDWSSGGGR